jgi:hypothetical protein
MDLSHHSGGVSPVHVENLIAARDKDSLWSTYPFPLFTLLSVFLLYVFFFAPTSVTLDGYSHLYGAKVLIWMMSGHPGVHSYYAYNSFLLPNWLCAVLLAGLSSILPNELALKILILLSMVLLLSSLYYCVDATTYRREQRAQVLIVLLPFASNAFLTLGFYGFLISSSLCLFVLGILLRHGLRMALRLQLIVACLLLVAYFSHPLPVVLSFLFPCAQFVAEVRVQHREGGLPSALKRPVFNLWPWALPACAIPWFYLRLAQAGERHTYSLTENVKDRISELARDALLHLSPTRSCGTLFIALLAILSTGVLLRRRVFSQNSLRFTSLTSLLGLTMVLYVFAPGAVGDGTGIANRVLLFSVFFLVLLALTSGVFEPRLLTLCSLIAALSVIGFGAEYLHVSKKLAPSVAELRLAMTRVPKQSRILILGYRLTPSCKRSPLLDRTVPEAHWALGSTLENQLIVLNDYQGRTSHFPLKYLGSRAQGSNDEVDLNSGQQRAAWLELLINDPDAEFVVSWGTPSGTSNCKETPVSPPFEEALRAKYDLVFAGQNASRVQLWKKRG